MPGALVAQGSRYVSDDLRDNLAGLRLGRRIRASPLSFFLCRRFKGHGFPVLTRKRNPWHSNYGLRFLAKHYVLAGLEGREQ